VFTGGNLSVAFCCCPSLLSAVSPNPAETALENRYSALEGKLLKVNFQSFLNLKGGAKTTFNSL
jgi:hypothetical protein